MDGQNSVLSVVGPLATSLGGLRLVTQALLSTKPWHHDPLTHEIPWRENAELAVSDPIRRLSNKLSFAVIRHDGACTPTPPVTRAVDIAVKAMVRLGHQVIDWKPKPNHKEVVDIGVTCWDFDGGANCTGDFELSGEEAAPQTLVTKAPQANATDIMAANVTKREIQKEYMEYWNSTAELTDSGRPVDAIICPVAPFPVSDVYGMIMFELCSSFLLILHQQAPRPGLFTYYGYTVWVNVLDYTSVVIPITNVDKTVDKKAENFEAVSDIDQKTQDSYDPDIYDGAHVAIQLVGRRLEEEKMLAIAKYVADAVRE